MSLTGATLLTQLSQFIDDSWSSTTTSAGAADGTTIVDTALQRFGDKTGEEGFVRILTDSTPAGNIYLVRRITSFIGSTITVAPGFPQQVATSISYEFHRYDPAKKFLALDRGRILAFPQVAIVAEDETITSDGLALELDVPAVIRRGPAQVWYEAPLSPNVLWNVLTNPRLTDATNWTATSVTTATYTRSNTDLIIPKMENSCVKLTSGLSGSLNQPLSTANAAKYAGRACSFGVWIYSRSALPTVSITDDSGTATSAVHGGLGWQFLQVSRNIAGTNATTLTPKINPLTNNAVYVERAFFGDVPRVPITYTNGPIPRLGVARDDAHARFVLARAAPRGFQYRLVGRTPITALGSNISSQATNTMEVGENDQDLLVAMAARILLTWEGFSTGELDQSMPQIKEVEQRFNEQKEDWRRRYPRMGYLDIEAPHGVWVA